MVEPIHEQGVGGGWDGGDGSLGVGGLEAAGLAGVGRRVVTVTYRRKGPQSLCLSS